MNGGIDPLANIPPDKWKRKVGEEKTTSTKIDASNINGVDSLHQSLDKAESEDSSDSESSFDSNSSDDEEFIYKDGFYTVNDSNGKETSSTRIEPVDYRALYEETRQNWMLWKLLIKTISRKTGTNGCSPRKV